MSTKQKRKTKPKAPRKEKAKPVRRRKVVEEKQKPAPPERKVEKAISEIPEKPYYLAVRLLGPFGTPAHIQSALTGLRLNRKFRAVLLEKNASMLGALREVKDYVTWGEVKSLEIAALLKERAELSNGMAFTDKFVKESFGHDTVEGLAQALARGQVSLKMLWQKGIVPVFRLHPPTGGFVSSIKRPFGSRGELGYRGAEISHLMTRMI
jgi:large subunit ribosomal protein L30